MACRIPATNNYLHRCWIIVAMGTNCSEMWKYNYFHAGYEFENVVHKMEVIHREANRPISRISQCIGLISHNTHISSVTKWCIVLYGAIARWDFINRSVGVERTFHDHAIMKWGLRTVLTGERIVYNMLKLESSKRYNFNFVSNVLSAAPLWA